MKSPSLSKAHFQLTGRCNLACRFCGQHKGMLAAADDELPVTKWLALADELKGAAEEAGTRPEIMLWGGEPLLYQEFDKLAETLHRQGFLLGVVTNATLLPRHAEVVQACIDRIFISVDGDRAEHDAMRGTGVYEKVLAGVQSIRRRRGRLTLLSTVSDLNVSAMAELPEKLLALGPDEVVLQPLMYLSKKEIEEYRAFSREHFNCDYPELTAWERDDDEWFQTQLAAGVKALAARRCPVPVRFTPHNYPAIISTAPCEAPLNRVHVRHDGAVGFCTDYFGFTIGNVKEHSLLELFHSDRAELFREAQAKNQLPVCNHCPWRLQHF